MKDKDPISSFVQESHEESGPRTKLQMKKEQGTAGFCLKASGSPAAMKRLAEIMNGIVIVLSKHQLPEEKKTRKRDDNYYGNETNYYGNETRGDINGTSYD